MRPTIDEYKKQIAATKERWKEREIIQAATMVQQAAVSAEHLTGIPEWDKYLTTIQPLLNQANSALKVRADLMPYAVDDRAIRQLQIEHAYLKGQVEAFQKAMDMPKDIIESAKSQLSQ